MKLKHLFLNTFLCGVIILHYSDVGEAPLAPICIPHEKQNKTKNKQTKSPKFTLKKILQATQNKKNKKKIEDCFIV